MRYGLIAVAAIAAILLALLQLEAGRSGLAQSEIRIGETPASVVHRADLDKPAPVVVIAHGFAGSRQLMEPFAFTLARAGYLTVSFDFVGHGAHPAAMPTRIEGAGGAAERLLDQLDAVIAGALAHPLADGRHALLGHSMATDLLAKHAAQGSSRAAATIAVSLLSRDVTATSPRNMLVIVGGYESGLTDEALRVTGLVAGAAAEEGRTYGSFAEGTARRAVFADGVEHIGVLYDPESLAAAAAWLDEAFGRSPVAEAALDRRGPWLGLLFAGLLALALPLSRLLPAIGTEATAGAALPRPTLLALIAGPALLTPLLAVLLPTGLLPIILGDYLAAHFFLYGAVGFAGLWIAARFGPARLPGRGAFSPGLLLGGLAVGAFTILAFGFALERYAFGYWPTAGRAALIPAMLAGVLPWFLADEWITRGRPGAAAPPVAPRLWAYALSKLAFVLSLGVAVALDLERLFFLLIVAPVILVFFAIYGLLSHWALRRSGHPWAAAIGLALALAWSISVSFPLVAG